MSQVVDGEETTEKERDRKDRFDALISLIIAVGAVAFLAGSQQYAGVSSSSSDPGAAVWPQVILVVLLLSSVINLINVYRRNDSITDLSGYLEPIADARTDDGSLQVGTETKKYLIGILLIAAYLVVLTDVGFLASTVVFLSLFIWTLGYRSIPKVAVFSIAVSVLVFILFRNFMNIALPYGTSVFRELSIFLEGLI